MAAVYTIPYLPRAIKFALTRISRESILAHICSIRLLKEENAVSTVLAIWLTIRSMNDRNGTMRYLMAVLPALVLPFAAAWYYFAPGRDPVLARAVYVGIKLFLLVWPVAAVRLLLNEHLPRIAWLQAKHWRALPLGALTGIGVALAAGGLMLTPLKEVALAAAPAIREKLVTLGVEKHYWLFAVFLSVIHAALEEYYWRWFVFGQLRRKLMLTPAVTVAALGFASHHIIILSQFFPLPWAITLGLLVGAGGAMWSLMFERQGTLSGAWISHALVDFGVMAIGYWVIM